MVTSTVEKAEGLVYLNSSCFTLFNNVWIVLIFGEEVEEQMEEVVEVEEDSDKVGW